jgi:N-acyl-D-glutamate deacylase
VDRATWESPTLASAGVEHVLVNGQPVFPAADGMVRPGKILRREPAARDQHPE